MVSSGRGPSERDIDKVVEMTGALKDEYEGVEVCACLGLLKDGQAERLKAAGVDAYNHNINTAESNHDNIVQTHTYADRVDTIGKAKTAGLSPCSGLIAGLGETDEQLVEALFALKALESDSIPVNFLMPFDGTPYENTWELSPQRCLKILAMARFVCPDKEIRIAGGREMHLRSLQGQALHVANSIFLGDYLTSRARTPSADLEMIRDNGFVILGQENAFNDGTFDEVFNAPRTSGHATPPRPRPAARPPAARAATAAAAARPLPRGKAAESRRRRRVTSRSIRRRGAGTEVPANA
jgi:biotin synthase